MVTGSPSSAAVISMSTGALSSKAARARGAGSSAAGARGARSSAGAPACASGAGELPPAPPEVCTGGSSRRELPPPPPRVFWLEKRCARVLWRMAGRMMRWGVFSEPVLLGELPQLRWPERGLPCAPGGVVAKVQLEVTTVRCRVRCTQAQLTSQAVGETRVDMNLH
ncbi:hypothetical protein T492DRAFT_1107060, partial [Pavlovales sp. CCMP2436]